MGTLASNVAELAAGLRTAAAELGRLSTVYRPADPLIAALDPANAHGTVLAAFPRDYTYKQPIDPLQAHRVAIVDPTQILIGDYVNDGSFTYFIGNTDPIMPIYAVFCNSVVTIARQSSTGATVGNVGRLGNVAIGANTTETISLRNWPASSLYSGRGAKTLSDLPTDEKAPQYTVLLPALPISVVIGDIVRDNSARSLVVRAVENNAGGTRLICMQAVQ